MDSVRTGYHSLADVTNQFMIVNFNDKRNYYKNMLYICQLVFKELFSKTIHTVRRHQMPVKKDENGYYIDRPKHLQLLLGIMVKDECGKHPLIKSDTVSIGSISVPNSKECNCGGADLCNIIDSTVSTRTETFNGQEYELKTYYERLSSGEVNEIREYPVFDATLSSVIIQKEKIQSCKLEVSKCGCPKPTEENKQKIVSSCGCMTFNTKCELPVLQNEHGYYNAELFGNKIYLKSDNDAKPLPSEVELIWQITPGADENAQVPDYALTTMFDGMHYFMLSWRRGSTLTPQEKREVERKWEKAKFELLMYLNPIDAHAFNKVSGIIHKWG